MKTGDKRAFIIPMLSVIAAIAFPEIFLFCQNAEEAAITEILPALLTFAVISIVAYTVLYALTHRAGKSALAVILTMLVLMHFTFIEQPLTAMIPNIKYWHTAPLVVVILAHLVYLIWRFVKEETAISISRIGLLVFGTLILINFVTAAPDIFTYIKNGIVAERVTENQPPEQDKGESGNKPNVYVFLFDEYANFPQMEEYYGYDNAVLRDFFNEHNFSVSLTSHNESDRTATVLTNLVNLDYVVRDETSASEKQLLRNNNELCAIFEGQGYEVKRYDGGFFGGGYPEGIEAGSKTGATTLEGYSLTDILMTRTIFYPLWNHSQQDGKYEMLKENILYIADYMSSKDNLPQGNTFTLIYNCFPHQPFLVDEDGNDVPASQYQNWDDQRYYLGQFKYATKQMIRMLGNIVENDPDAIVIVQSDHGARRGPVDKWPRRDIKTNFLNAVYYAGNDLDIEGLTGINTLRFLLNEMFDMDFDFLPLPEWRYK